MSEAVIIALVGGVMSGGTIAAILKFIAARHKDPIDQAQAEASMAAQAQTMTLEWAKGLQADIARLREDGLETQRQMEAARKDFEHFRDQVKGRLNVWERWYESLVAHWGELRQSETPLEAPDTSEYTSLIATPYRYY